MAIRVQRHANVSKQATLLDGLDFCMLKWRVCGCGLNRFVHEGMNHISNVEVHLKDRNGNVIIYSKTCVKRPLKNRQNKDLDDKWYEGRSICNENSPVYPSFIYYCHKVKHIPFYKTT